MHCGLHRVVISFYIKTKRGKRVPIKLNLKEKKKSLANGPILYLCTLPHPPPPPKKKKTTTKKKQQKKKTKKKNKKTKFGPELLFYFIEGCHCIILHPQEQDFCRFQQVQISPLPHLGVSFLYISVYCNMYFGTITHSTFFCSQKIQYS